MMSRMAPLTLAVLVALVGINAWLLSVVVQVADPEEPAADLTKHVPRLPAVATEPASPKPIDAHSHILARPVFFKMREPFVPSPPPPPTPQVRPPTPVVTDPGFALGGIMINGQTKRAYVFSKNNSQGQWLGEGGIIMGWTVDTIESGAARLQQGGRTIELHLYPPTR